MGDTIEIKTRWKEAKGTRSEDFFRVLDESVDIDIPVDLTDDRVDCEVRGHEND